MSQIKHITAYRESFDETESQCENRGPFLFTNRGLSTNSLRTMRGKWCGKETVQFLAFVQRFYTKYERSEGREQWNFFKVMSAFLKSRNTNQCRSFFYKLRNKFGKINEIFRYFSSKILDLEREIDRCLPELQVFDQKFQEFQNKQNATRKGQKDGLSPRPFEAKEVTIEAVRTGTEYMAQEITPIPQKIQCSMSDSFLRLFYHDLWKSQKESEVKKEQESLPKKYGKREEGEVIGF